MQQFLQTLVSGLALGSIYGSLALALVLIYKATEVINFAQGEMAMFTTYIAWALMEHHGQSYWVAFGITPIALAVTGLSMWLVRRRKRRAKRGPPAGGAAVAAPTGGVISRW